MLQGESRVLLIQTWSLFNGTYWLYMSHFAECSHKDKKYNL